jgi:cellulase
MDIFEANSRSQQIAPHTCNKTGLYKCTGDECAFEGVCDKNGCGFNTYRHNNAKFYGRGLAVDTTKPFTVVTQFPTNMDGDLESIHRFYIQNGKIIKTPVVNIAGFRPAIDFINDAYCNATNSRKYMGLGATKEMGESLKRGMVLIFSIWWDESGFMKWLDAEEAGPCNATEGNPTYIRQIQPDTDVTWSKVKWGEINSTWSVPAALGEEL